VKRQSLQFSLVIVVMVVITSCGAASHGGTAIDSPTYDPKKKTACLTEEVYVTNLKALSNTIPDEATRAKQQLLKVAALSDQCKTEVVFVLMKAMDKPNLNFRDDFEGYRLWRNGAEILGELKATESLDLLISNLNLTGWDFSTSMKHQPALLGVIMIGPPAIPKLQSVLQSNSNPGMRYSAVFGIAAIGGTSAVHSLQEAREKESDKCVLKLINASLDNFDENGQLKNRADWFSAVACPQ
jgi:HEAT repeat protein